LGVGARDGLDALGLAFAQDADLLGFAVASVWMRDASCRDRSYSALPWLVWMSIDSSDSVMNVCCLARDSASRSSFSFIAAFCCRVYVSTCSSAIWRHRRCVRMLSI